MNVSDLDTVIFSLIVCKHVCFIRAWNYLRRMQLFLWRKKKEQTEHMIFKNLLKCASFMREHKRLVNHNNVNFIAAVYDMV